MKNLRGAEIPPQISTENSLRRLFGGFGAVGGCGGSTGSNYGGANDVVGVGSTHRDDEYRILLSSPSNFGAQNPATNSQQPLGIFESYRSNSSEEMVPFFTIAQWKELERQAMIYKYMISTEPVPLHLLYPHISSTYNVGYTKNGGALELGRCKRTDGKKWRCSRDVAPHQKYCERHLHRGRPRSRKPVELDGNDTIIINGNEGIKKPRVEKTPQTLLPYNDRKFNGDLGSITENDAYSNKGSPFYIPTGLFNKDYPCTGQQEVNQLDHQMLSHSEFPIDLLGGWPVGGYTNKNEDFSTWLNLSMGMPALDQGIGDGIEAHDEGARWSGPVCYSELFGPGPLGEALGPKPTSPVSSPSMVI